MYGPEVLGRQAREKITGLEGIITGRCEYLYGCNQLCLVPPSKDNKPSDGYWFDESRIEITGAGIDPDSVRGEDPGGPSMGPEAH